MNLTKLTKTLRHKDARASFTRKAIALCALSMAAGPVFAQQGLDLGLRVMVQTTSLINSTDQAAGKELDYKNKVTAGGGIAGGYNFNNHMGAELDILYSKQGQGYIGDAAQISSNSNAILSNEFRGLAASNNIPFSGSYTANIALTCIKIPILFRYTGDATKSWFFSSFIGPQINMLSSAVFTVNGQTASFSSYGIKPEDMFKKTTLDAVIGVGVGINLSDNLVLGVHLRLDYGLGDVENKSETVTTGGTTSKAYDATRAVTNNATGGGLISLNYKFVKKAPAKPATPAAPPKPGQRAK
jgi:outer membrane protein with beta-barrel domain